MSAVTFLSIYLPGNSFITLENKMFEEHNEQKSPFSTHRIHHPVFSYNAFPAFFIFPLHNVQSNLSYKVGTTAYM